MPETGFTHRLTGCAPIPLAHYLKALGILRLVAEQADPNAQGWWSGDVFHLRTVLDEPALRQYFLEDYRPTPVVAPWNGGSGFFPKDNQAAISQLLASQCDRLAVYRQTIEASQKVLTSLGLKEKPDGDSKALVLVVCRSRLPDEALSSLDSAYVLTGDGPKYPPLLGTGLNDGRLEFTNNFMQRLLDLVEAESGRATQDADRWWREAFFSAPSDGLQRNSILGQFDPGAVERPVNPWDFVLMLEGAFVFSSAAVKRLETAEKGILSYPFCVRSAGVGYGSSASDDETSCRAEMWLPLWKNPSTRYELDALFTEGRAQIRDRPAKNGIDFARAIATLGIDRGIKEFARVGFHARNGLAYFAVPLGRFRSEPNPRVNLLSEPRLDGWLESFRRAASGDNAPSRASRALRRLEAAILELCKEKSAANLQDILIALGEAEAVLSVSPKWRAEAFQRPVPLLSSQWLLDCDDESVEFRLAASLAAIHSDAVGGLRQYCEPVEINGSRTVGSTRWVDWSEDSSAMCRVVWHDGNVEDNLISVLNRRTVEAVQRGTVTSDGVTIVFPEESLIPAQVYDVNQFLAGDTDDERLSSLFRGLLLIDWDAVGAKPLPAMPEARDEVPSAAYVLLKLCHTPFRIRETFVRLDPAIARLACSGRLNDATRLAGRRLLGSGLPPAEKVVAGGSRTARRIAAALMFPLGFFDIERLADGVLKLEVPSR